MEQINIDTVNGVCPDCGCERMSLASGTCPRCGFHLDHQDIEVKVLKADEVYNPYGADYDSICRKIQSGEESNAAAEEYVTDM